MDDEKSVRDLIQRILESAGFAVYAVAGGREAIHAAADPDLPIDILVTDILMPYMNGKDLATRISSMRPLIKVVFVSAYSAGILTTHHLCPEGADFIKKPFTGHLLLERIDRVWAASPRWTDLVAKRS